MDAKTRPIAALAPLPEPERTDPDRDARIRREMAEHMLRALRGCDQRLADHFVWFAVGGR